MRAGRLLACGLLLALAACSRAGRDWKEAERTDTPAAYERFVATHPTSEHVAEARLRIERFAYQEANQSAAPERRRALESFLARFPRADLAPRVRRTIEEMDFETANSSGLLGDLDAYLRTYPAGIFAAEARSRLEKRLADRPAPFRALRRVRLRVEKDFTWENWNPDEQDEPTDEPFEPNVDFENAGRTWLADAGLVTVAPDEPADGELWIRASGTPVSELYNFDDVDFPLGRYEGAELSGRVRLSAGSNVAVERRFYGEIVAPERLSVTVHALGALPFNQASDAPFDRAALRPGSFQERLAEVICAALGPSVLAGKEPGTVETWNGLSEARMRKIHAECGEKAR